MTKRAKSRFSPARLVDHVLRGAGSKTPTILLGPVVWTIDPGSDARSWYFITCAISAEGQLLIDRLNAKHDQKLAENVRAGLALELIQRKPIVLHDFSDELEMARWCEVYCPGERSSRIRAQLEREQAGP